METKQKTEQAQSTAQHIPGPWKVLDHYGVHVLAEGGLTIATVPHQLDYARIEGRVQIQNARLIAAAPELLAACQRAVQFETGTPWAREMLAAIAKATGEQA